MNWYNKLNSLVHNFNKIDTLYSTSDITPHIYLTQDYCVFIDRIEGNLYLFNVIEEPCCEWFCDIHDGAIDLNQPLQPINCIQKTSLEVFKNEYGINPTMMMYIVNNQERQRLNHIIIVEHAIYNDTNKLYKKMKLFRSALLACNRQLSTQMITLFLKNKFHTMALNLLNDYEDNTDLSIINKPNYTKLFKTTLHKLLHRLSNHLHLINMTLFRTGLYTDLRLYICDFIY